MDAVTIRRKSSYMAGPANAAIGNEDTFIAYNRFRRPSIATANQLPLNSFDLSRDEFENAARHERSCSRAQVRPPLAQPHGAPLATSRAAPPSLIVALMARLVC